MKKQLIVVIIFTLMIFFTVGCFNNVNHLGDEEKIIGLWERINFIENQTWEFTEGNKIMINTSDLDINYTFFEGFLYIFYTEINYVDKHDYYFDNNDVLTLELVAGGGAIDRETGEIIDLKNDTMNSIFTFHKIS